MHGPAGDAGHKPQRCRVPGPWPRVDAELGARAGDGNGPEERAVAGGPALEAAEIHAAVAEDDGQGPRVWRLACEDAARADGRAPVQEKQAVEEEFGAALVVGEPAVGLRGVAGSEGRAGVEGAQEDGALGRDGGVQGPCREC